MTNRLRSLRPGRTAPRVVTAERGRLLLVDDEMRLTGLYEKYLGTCGFHVTGACDGQDALDKLDRGAVFDAIISDLTMPRMNGVALLAAVRERDRDVPFVLVSAAPTTESALAAIEQGAYRYLRKPVTLVELEKVADEAVRAGRELRKRKRAVELQSHVDDVEAGRAQRHDEVVHAIDALYMHYQPIVSVAAQTTFAYEALARTSDPLFPTPTALLEEAEQHGELGAFGRAVRAIVPIAARDVPPPALLFVNLHAHDLEDPSLYDPASPLAVHAERVVLEITERAPIEQVPDVQEKLAALRALGYRIALDDIGAGYANLSSFALIEPEVVKLDMSLVRDVDRCKTKQRLARSIVGLCRDLGILLVAEGVETEHERDTLIALGCDLFQGFLFARPGPGFPLPSFAPCAPRFAK